MGSECSLPLPLFSPFFFPLPVLSLTKRWDFHSMHTVAAYKLMGESHISHRKASSPQRVIKGMQYEFFKNLNRGWLAQPLLDLRFEACGSSGVSLWSDGQTTCVHKMSLKRGNSVLELLFNHLPNVQGNTEQRRHFRAGQKEVKMVNQGIKNRMHASGHRQHTRAYITSRSKPLGIHRTVSQTV